jgi:hypothetical protein
LYERDKDQKGFDPLGLFVVLGLSIWFGGLPNVSAATFDYAPYQQFLDRYVTPGQYIGAMKLNVVDYDAIYKNREKPDSLYRKILQQLTVFDPDTLQNREVSLYCYRGPSQSSAFLIHIRIGFLSPILRKQGSARGHR